MKPLTDAERKTLEDLQARDEAARTAEIERQRKEEAQAFKPVAAFVNTVDLEAINKSIDEALKSNPDEDTIVRLRRVRQVLQYDIGHLKSKAEDLGV